MTAQEQEILMMYNTLPETEQGLAYELLRRLVLAWDPDFTKLPPLNVPTWRNLSAV